MEAESNRSAVEEQTMLRDRLALDRTKLANERTLMAYIRTALATLAVGGTLVQFFDSTASTVTGWAFITSGLFMLGIGVWRFQSVAARLKRL